MSNLLVLGGGGRTGIHVLKQAAVRGHRVRALVRNPDTVQAPAGGELIQGTPASIDDIRKAAKGTEAVLSSLNNSRASDNPWAKPVSPPMFMTDAARNTLTVMGEQDIRRIVLTSTQGAGDDWARLSPLVKAVHQGRRARDQSRRVKESQEPTKTVDMDRSTVIICRCRVLKFKLLPHA
ncbi:NAD(P)-dependent oxidoreductase [Streptomyces sp. NPDC101152]|uniref:NAD(P)-dependent oxidoreductase n=1 Tax=Streptomyces sp. NPDC101152 TaxID=3366116 RepID=UPI0037FD8D29